MTFSRTALLTAALATGFMFAQTTDAAPLVEETFTYDDGGLAGENGGVGFTGAWANTRGGPTVVSTGLTAGDLAVAGGTSRGAAWSGVARPIAGTLAGNLTDTSTLWFSVIVGFESSVNTSNADINIALTNAAKFNSGSFTDRENLDGAANEGVGITHTGGNIRAVYWDNAGGRTESAATSVSIGNGTVNPLSALIVGKVVWGPAGETVSLYAPDTNLNLGTAILADWAIPNLNQTSFNNLALQYKDSPLIDEIRFGATSADVLPAVPEPSSLALLGLGGLLIARRRRG